MAFTDVEMAILSQCAYYNFPDGSEKQSLYEFLCNNESKLKKKLGIQYESAINSLIKKVKGKDYTIVESMNDKNRTGFAAFAIKDPNNEVTVACRGTELTSIYDLNADAELTMLEQTSQQEKMLQFVRKLEKKYNFDGYYFTGHSLGGNLAMYGAIMLSDLDKLKNTVVFNAPGFNKAFWKVNGDRISKAEDRITHYQNEMDGVSESLTSPGNIVIVECRQEPLRGVINFLGFEPHGLGMLVISEDGKSFKKNKSGKKSPTVLGAVMGLVTAGTDIVVGTVTYVTLGVCNFFKKGNKWLNGDLVKTLKEAAIEEYIKDNQQITIDTYKLKIYAQRLQAVNKRLSSLDSRIDKLYKKAGFLDLWNLILSDYRIGYSRSINNCANYLNNTASNFNNAEQSIASAL